MMRLFVALEPAPDFRDALTVLQDRLRVAGVGGQYLSPDILHMTLAFIGMWPENITGLLPPVYRPFSITLSHLCIFQKANVLCAGVSQSEALHELAHHVRQNLTQAEVPFDRREFNPHITLIRKLSMPDTLLLSSIDVPKSAMTVREICLYRSDRGVNGMVYTVIGRSGERKDIEVEI